MLGEGELEVHGIWNRSLVYREEVRLDQTIRNIIFGDAEISLVVIQLGVTRLKKTGFVYLLAVVWRKGREGVVWFSVWASLDDWANGGFVDVFFTHGMVLVLWGSLCYSKEWVWNLRTKLCCIASGMWSSASGTWSRVSLQELEIRYIITYNFCRYHVNVAKQLNHFPF